MTIWSLTRRRAAYGLLLRRPNQLTSTTTKLDDCIHRQHLLEHWMHSSISSKSWMYVVVERRTSKLSLPLVASSTAVAPSLLPFEAIHPMKKWPSSLLLYHYVVSSLEVPTLLYIRGPAAVAWLDSIIFGSGIFRGIAFKLPSSYKTVLFYYTNNVLHCFLPLRSVSHPDSKSKQFFVVWILPLWRSNVLSQLQVGGDAKLARPIIPSQPTWVFRRHIFAADTGRFFTTRSFHVSFVTDRTYADRRSPHHGRGEVVTGFFGSRLFAHRNPIPSKDCKIQNATKCRLFVGKLAPKSIAACFPTTLGCFVAFCCSCNL